MYIWNHKNKFSMVKYSDKNECKFPPTYVYFIGLGNFAALWLWCYILYATIDGTAAVPSNIIDFDIQYVTFTVGLWLSMQKYLKLLISRVDSNLHKFMWLKLSEVKPTGYCKVICQ